MEATYECRGCKKSFNSTQLQFEIMPDNMNIDTPGVEVENGIPKCPLCGYLEFFKLKIIDIAF